MVEGDVQKSETQFMSKEDLELQKIKAAWFDDLFKQLRKHNNDFDVQALSMGTLVAMEVGRLQNREKELTEVVRDFEAQLTAAKNTERLVKKERDELEGKLGDWMPCMKCEVCNGTGDAGEERAGCSKCGSTGGVWMTWKERAEYEEQLKEGLQKDLEVALKESGNHAFNVINAAHKALDRVLTPRSKSHRSLLERIEEALQTAEGVAHAASFDFAAHLQRQREWSERTFGPSKRTKGVLDHIRKELLEIEAEPNDITEWIDVVILALDGAWRHGASPQQIIATLAAKQAKNEARQWPDWRTQPEDKAICHTKPAEGVEP